MAVAKAPVYREKNHQPNVLNDLLEQAERAMEELNFVCRANLPISKVPGNIIGYGIEATKKTIVCDHLVSIIKEIKKIKGW
jgi:hypothetical protein